VKTYYIVAKITANVGLPIKAESLENALEQSKGLKDEDFIKVKGEWQDGKHEITGLYVED